MFRFPSSDDSVPAALLLWLVVQALIVCATAGAMTVSVLSGGRAVWFGAVTFLSGAVAMAAVEMLRRQHSRTLVAVGDREVEIERLTRQFTERDAEWREVGVRRSAALQELLEHLLDARLTAALERAKVPAGVRHPLVDDGVAALLEQIVAVVAQGSGELWDRLESSELVLAAVTRKVQVSAHRIQAAALQIAEEHPADAGVLKLSMRVDHAAQQQARQAQSLAVLCGQWPGQLWPEPLRLVEVVRAAAGRITAHERVEVAGDQAAAVAARAAEALIHVVAELLGNASESSPPSTPVQAVVRQVQQGVVIEIDDHGVGLDEHRLELANQIASGRREVRLDELGETPETGLAVVGKYVRRHGIQVELLPSIYGGIRAVVRVPPELTEILAPLAMARTAPLTGLLAAPSAVAEPDLSELMPEAGNASGGPAGPEPGVAGLPQRRSPRHDTAHGRAHGGLYGGPRPSSAAGPPAEVVAPRTPEQAGAWAGAYFGATGTGEGTEGGSAHSAPGTDEEVG